MQKFRYACFSKLEHCIDGEASDSPSGTAILKVFEKNTFFIFLLEDRELDIEDLTDVHVLSRLADGDLIVTPISVSKAFISE